MKAKLNWPKSKLKKELRDQLKSQPQTVKSTEDTIRNIEELLAGSAYPLGVALIMNTPSFIEQINNLRGQLSNKTYLAIQRGLNFKEASQGIFNMFDKYPEPDVRNFTKLKVALSSQLNLKDLDLSLDDRIYQRIKAHRDIDTHDSTKLLKAEEHPFICDPIVGYLRAVNIFKDSVLEIIDDPFETYLGADFVINGSGAKSVLDFLLPGLDWTEKDKIAKEAVAFIEKELSKHNKLISS